MSDTAIPGGRERFVALVHDVVTRVAIGQPIAWQGLTVFPLLAPEQAESPWLTFGAAHAAGTFRITEVSDSGVVGELEAINEGDRDVLLLDGEEVIGAKQNRIINLTVLVPARSRVRIPVSCVEQGRWNLQSKAFREAGRTVYAHERARKTRDVTARLRTSGRADADQSAVWASIASELGRSRVSSPTGAMSDLYEQRPTLESYVERLAPAESQVGAVFGVGGRVAGMELFDSAAAWAASAPKVIRSYAYAAGGTASSSPGEADAASLLRSLEHVPATVHAAPGAGAHVRFENGGLVGAALVHEDRVLHLMAFATP